MADQRPTVSEQLRAAISAYLPGQNELARNSGVDPSQLSRFVNEKRGLEDSAISKICQVLRLELRPIDG